MWIFIYYLTRNPCFARICVVFVFVRLGRSQGMSKNRFQHVAAPIFDGESNGDIYIFEGPTLTEISAVSMGRICSAELLFVEN